MTMIHLLVQELVIMNRWVMMILIMEQVSKIYKCCPECGGTIIHVVMKTMMVK